MLFKEELSLPQSKKNVLNELDNMKTVLSQNTFTFNVNWI